MEGAWSCPVCNNVPEKADCSCRSALSRFFTLLQTGDSRSVSTLKVQSRHKQGRACIDKLTFALPSPVSVAEIYHKLSTQSIACVKVKLRDHKWYIRVGDSDSGTFVHLGQFDSQWTSKIVTRPSAFSDFASYQAHLNTSFGGNLMDQAKIVRCDFAVDYDTTLVSLLRGLDVANKQVVTQFTAKGSEKTGVMIGKGSEKVVVYDKSRDLNSAIPCTRIEVQLTGAKVPSLTLNELKTKTSAGKVKTGFENLSLHDVDLIEAITIPREQDQERRRQLDLVLSREGLLSARKTLDVNGNFQRNYGSLMTLHPWEPQPHEVLTNELKQYFSDTIKKESLHAYH